MPTPKPQPTLAELLKRQLSLRQYGAYLAVQAKQKPVK